MAPTMNSRTKLPKIIEEELQVQDAAREAQMDAAAQQHVLAGLEDEVGEYRATYKALNFFGADGLTNTLNTLLLEGWSIYKIFFSTGPHPDSGIVVFEKWEEVMNVEKSEQADTESTSA